MYFNKQSALRKTIIGCCSFMLALMFCSGAYPRASKNDDIVDLKHVGSNSFEEILKSRTKYKNQEKHGEFDWNNIFNENLLDIKITSSSQLRNYHAANVIDGKISNAWVEGKEDEGRGEWIRISIKKQKKHKKIDMSIGAIGIFPGLGVENYFKKNNRVKTLLCELKYKNKVHTYRLYFEDAYKLFLFQFLDLDISLDLSADEPVEFTFIIEDVYRGSQWNDTCISEIFFEGRGVDKSKW